MKTLSTSATSLSTQPNQPPTITAIVKAGVEEFKSTTKTLHRVGIKRQPKRKNKLPSKKFKVDPLLKAATSSVGRPKLKKTQRKQPPLPRQVNEIAKSKMMKAATLLRKG